MSNCKQFHKLIDEADQPGALPFEASSHLASCVRCQTFSSERAQLRAMLSDMPRVNAPAYFDARLAARLAKAKTSGPPSWFRPTVYARFGAATAVLVITVFAAQYSGLLSMTNSKGNAPAYGNNIVADSRSNPGIGGAPATVPNNDVANSSKPSSNGPSITPSITRPVSQNQVRYSPGRRTVPSTPVQLREGVVDDQMYVPMVIVQGKNGSSRVPMLPVSVGAQQRMLNRSGSVSAQPIGVSF